MNKLGAKDFSLQGVFGESNGTDTNCYLWCIAYRGPNAFTVTNFDFYLGPSKADRMP